MNLVTLFNLGCVGRWGSAYQSPDWQVGCAGSVISARGRALVPPGRSQRSDASGDIRRKGEPVLAEKVFIIVNKGWHTLSLYLFVLLYKECVSFQMSPSRCHERGHKVFLYHPVVSSGALSPEFIALALSCCPLLRLCSAQTPAVPWEKGCAWHPRCGAAVTASWRAPARGSPHRSWRLPWDRPAQSNACPPRRVLVKQLNFVNSVVGSEF